MFVSSLQRWVLTTGEGFMHPLNQEVTKVFPRLFPLFLSIILYSFCRYLNQLVDSHGQMFFLLVILLLIMLIIINIWNECMYSVHQLWWTAIGGLYVAIWIQYFKWLRKRFFFVLKFEYMMWIGVDLSYVQLAPRGCRGIGSDHFTASRFD